MKRTTPELPALYHAVLKRCAPDLKTGCLLWQGCRHIDGHGMIRIQGRLYYAHRLVWMAWYGSIPPAKRKGGLVVRHLCNVEACCNIDHLKLGTQSQNIRDQYVSKRRQLQTRDATTGHWRPRDPWEE